MTARHVHSTNPEATRPVTITVDLPLSLADTVEHTDRRTLSRVVRYGMTRAVAYRHLMEQEILEEHRRHERGVIRENGV